MNISSLFKSDAYPTQQNSVFTEFLDALVFIFTSISSWEMHKNDNASNFNNSLEIHEEKLIIILTHGNALAFPCNRTVGYVLQTWSREEGKIKRKKKDTASNRKY